MLKVRCITKRKGSTHSSKVLEIIHTDICEPFPTVIQISLRYFISYINDFSRHAYVSLIADKSNVLDFFKVYKIEEEYQLEKAIKIVNANSGVEYCGRYVYRIQLLGPFTDFLQDCGIVRQYILHNIILYLKEETYTF